MAINAKSSQDFVPIKEVRNGVIVLKDGSLRSILNYFFPKLIIKIL